MAFSGLSPNGRLVEIAEMKDHPFMVGSQFHPEFKSRPNRPHPLFNAFLAAAVARQEARENARRDMADAPDAVLAKLGLQTAAAD
jgi:CTP synthase